VHRDSLLGVSGLGSGIQIKTSNFTILFDVAKGSFPLINSDQSKLAPGSRSTREICNWVGSTWDGECCKCDS